MTLYSDTTFIKSKNLGIVLNNVICTENAILINHRNVWQLYRKNKKSVDNKLSFIDATAK